MNSTKAVSKFLSYTLRHHPPAEIDENGYVPVDVLLKMINHKRAQKSPMAPLFTVMDLEELVSSNDKQRFAFDEEKTHLRASQGHSIEVDLELEAVEPPEILYHGTGAQHVKSIMSLGVQKRGRQHVHLSEEYIVASTVGGRHGKPVVLKVYALSMHQMGYPFYLSDNGVWLTDQVPTRFLTTMK